MFTAKILSSKVCFPTKEDIESIAKKCKKNNGKYIVVTNAHNQYLAHTNKDYLKVHNNALACISDSQILNYSSLFLYGKKVPKVFLGSKIMKIMLSAAPTDTNIGLYGSSKETILNLKKNLMTWYPNINITFTLSPPFRQLTKTETKKIVDEINNKNVDLLFVGLGCPKQELWMYENQKKLNCLSIGVGAAFDFNAFPSQEIPEQIHKIGFGALYRLLKNPKLFGRYLIDGSKFLYHLCLEKIQLSSTTE